MKRLPLTLALCSLLAACTTPQQREEDYCDRFRLPRTSPEYAACRAYYVRMENRFAADTAECRARAEAAYPLYLDDHPRYGEAQSIDRFGRIRSSTVLIEPDYQRNALLEKERRTILIPCMHAKGWKDPDSWKNDAPGTPGFAR